MLTRVDLRINLDINIGYEAGRLRHRRRIPLPWSDNPADLPRVVDEIWRSGGALLARLT
jgi:hypothetical protein